MKSRKKPNLTISAANFTLIGLKYKIQRKLPFYPHHARNFSPLIPERSFSELWRIRYRRSSHE